MWAATPGCGTRKGNSYAAVEAARRARLLLSLLHLGGHFALVGLQLLKLGGARHLLKLFLGGYVDALELGHELGRPGLVFALVALACCTVPLRMVRT